MLFKIVFLVTLVSIALSAPTKSENKSENHEPSDILEVADWTRLQLFYNSERVERVFDDSISKHRYKT